MYEVVCKKIFADSSLALSMFVLSSFNTFYVLLMQILIILLTIANKRYIMDDGFIKSRLEFIKLIIQAW